MNEIASPSRMRFDGALEDSEESDSGVILRGASTTVLTIDRAFSSAGNKDFRRGRAMHGESKDYEIDA